MNGLVFSSTYNPSDITVESHQSALQKISRRKLKLQSGTRVAFDIVNIEKGRKIHVGDKVWGEVVVKTRLRTNFLVICARSREPPYSQHVLRGSRNGEGRRGCSQWHRHEFFHPYSGNFHEPHHSIGREFIFFSK